MKNNNTLPASEVGDELIEYASNCIRSISNTIAITPRGPLRDHLYSQLVFMVNYRKNKLNMEV